MSEDSLTEKRQKNKKRRAVFAVRALSYAVNRLPHSPLHIPRREPSPPALGRAVCVYMKWEEETKSRNDMFTMQDGCAAQKIMKYTARIQPNEAKGPFDA